MLLKTGTSTLYIYRVRDNIFVATNAGILQKQNAIAVGEVATFI
jgi:hypothetical protein